MRRTCVLLIATLVALAGLAAAPASAFQHVTHDQVVNENPDNWTPQVLDGEVDALVEVGQWIVAGGNFTRVQAASGGPVLTRNSIMAFNKSTGAISTSFVPQLDGVVKALATGPDGTVYVGGNFNNVNGSNGFKITQLRVSDATQVGAFRPGVTNAIVQDIRYVDGRLFMGGDFTRVQGEARNHLAELDPTTGNLLSRTNVSFDGTHYGGNTLIRHMDVSPDGSKLVAIGNFTSVDGQQRVEVAMLDIGGANTTLSSWHTDRYEPRCYNVFRYIVRDVEFSPDGSYFVIGGTGGYGSGSPSLCDSVTRWESDATGPDQDPTWIEYTGGDSLYSVAVTGSVIYVGGHNRWLNNPSRADAWGPGGVDRSGIGAVDPVNGVPLSWNPGRTRGQGVFDMLATSEGLFIGTDTDRVRGEYHARLAFFPLAGGHPVPQPEQPNLPVDVYSLATSGSNAVKRGFDGSDFGAASPVTSPGIDWSNVRGAAYMNGSLYTAWADGHLYKRSFDGTTFGAAQDINLNGLTNFASEMQSMTGMFYDHGRLYFTRSGSTRLQMRYFTVESDIVGAGLKDLQPFTVANNLSDLDWSRVQGMFLAENRLYWGDRTNGNLHRINWVDGAPVQGTDAVVSGPAIDGIDWRQRALFADPGEPNSPPNAVINNSCSGLECSFNSSNSTDSDGSIQSRSWSFGDGDTSTAVSPTHTYDESDTYEVSLTVVDDDGDSDTATRTVQVSDAQQGAVSFVAAAGDPNGGSARNHRLTLPASIEAGDSLLLFFSDNSPGASVDTPAGWAQVGTESTGRMGTRIWSRTATASDAGSTVTVTTGQFVRGDLAVSAYDGAATVQPGDTTTAPETESRQEHTTPTASATQAGSWLVSYWADKTGDTTSWTAPASQTVRHTHAGTGGGHLSMLTTDSNGTIGVGQTGGLTAVADSASRQATMATIVLQPAP